MDWPPALRGAGIALDTSVVVAAPWGAHAAAIAAARRETTLAWTLFVVASTRGLIYLAATLFYRVATFAQHPASSASSITGCLA